jgi:hypothetical protein
LFTLLLCRVPFNAFQPSYWTRTLIWSLREYTYGQSADCNTFVHGANLSASRITHRLSFNTQITGAYNNSSSILVDESFTFGLLLTLQVNIPLPSWRHNTSSLRLGNGTSPIYATKNAAIKTPSQNCPFPAPTVATPASHQTDPNSLTLLKY